jgi:spermidine synthase
LRAKQSNLDGESFLRRTAHTLSAAERRGLRLGPSHKGLGSSGKFRFLIADDAHSSQIHRRSGEPRFVPRADQVLLRWPWLRVRPGRREGGLMARGLDDERLRRLIADYFGAASRLRVLRAAATFGAPVFVVDFDRGPRHYRTFGSFGPSFGTAFLDEPQLTEQSSMDLLYPAQLVFHYERLMSLAFALVERPVTALLLGVGGGAMWRFLRAYLPECAPILVDADETVMTIARRWFYLTQPVTIETAQRFLAGSTARFDVVLVDLYDAHGPASYDDAFWGRCIDALAPGGCLATNWADFASNIRVRPMAEAQLRMARARGLDGYFVTRRGFRDNLIQYLPTGSERQPEAITAALERFARNRHLPDRGRGILEQCLISPGFPLET